MMALMMHNKTLSIMISVEHASDVLHSSNASCCRNDLSTGLDGIACR